jgi:hypothetical protein
VVHLPAVPTIDLPVASLALAADRPEEPPWPES